MSRLIHGPPWLVSMVVLPEELKYGSQASVWVADQCCSQCGEGRQCLMFDTSGGEYGYASLCPPCIDHLFAGRYLDVDGNLAPFPAGADPYAHGAEEVQQ